MSRVKPHVKLKKASNIKALEGTAVDSFGPNPVSRSSTKIGVARHHPA